MRHSYLSKKDIYFALHGAQITRKESRELIKQIDRCKMSMPKKVQTRKEMIVNEIELLFR